MTPKEKAKKLYEMYFYAIPSFTDEGQLEHETSKKCALIAVDEILQEIDNTTLSFVQNDYWQEVKQEIEKL